MTKEINKSSNKSFGLVFFIVFLLIGIYPLLKDGELRVWSIIISLIFLFLGLLNSKLLSPLNRLWFKFGTLLGKIISPFIMLIIFFFVVTPVAMIMRTLGKDLLNLKYNKNKSYWIKKRDVSMSFIKEFWEFLRVRKKYWLLPIIIVLVLFGGLIVLTQGSAVAPFIYTIF